MLRKIFSHLRGTFSFPGVFGWIPILVWLFNSISNLVGGIEFIQAHFASISNFLNSGLGTAACLLIGSFIIGYSIVAKEHQSKQTVPRETQRMTPMTLIIIGLGIGLIGLLVASTGVIQLKYSSAPPQQNNEQLKRVLDKTRTSREKTDLDNAIHDLADIMNNSSMEALRKTAEFERTWNSSYESAKRGAKPKVQELENNMKELQDLTAQLVNDMNVFRKKYISYGQELNFLLNPEFPGEQMDVDGVLNNIQRTEKEINDVLIRISRLPDEETSASMMVLVTESKFKEFIYYRDLLTKWKNGVERNTTTLKPAVQ